MIFEIPIHDLCTPRNGQTCGRAGMGQLALHEAKRALR